MTTVWTILVHNKFSPLKLFTILVSYAGTGVALFESWRGYGMVARHLTSIFLILLVSFAAQGEANPNLFGINPPSTPEAQAVASSEPEIDPILLENAWIERLLEPWKLWKFFEQTDQEEQFWGLAAAPVIMLLDLGWFLRSAAGTFTTGIPDSIRLARNVKTFRFIQAIKRNIQHRARDLREKAGKAILAAQALRNHLRKPPKHAPSKENLDSIAAVEKWLSQPKVGGFFGLDGDPADHPDGAGPKWYAEYLRLRADYLEEMDGITKLLEATREEVTKASAMVNRLSGGLLSQRMLRHVPKETQVSIEHTDKLGELRVIDANRNSSRAAIQLDGVQAPLSHAKSDCEQLMIELGKEIDLRKRSSLFSFGKATAHTVIMGSGGYLLVSGIGTLEKTHNAELGKLRQRAKSKEEAKNRQQFAMENSLTKELEKMRAKNSDPELLDFYKIAMEITRYHIKDIAKEIRKSTSEEQRTAADFEERLTLVSTDDKESDGFLYSILDTAIAAGAVTEFRIDPLGGPKAIKENLFTQDENKLRSKVERFLMVLYGQVITQIWPRLMIENSSYPIEPTIPAQMSRETRSRLSSLIEKNKAAKPVAENNSNESNPKSTLMTPESTTSVANAGG